MILTRSTHGRARSRPCSIAMGWRSRSWRRSAWRRSSSGFVAWHDASVIFGTHTGPGAFYRLMPHNAMAGLFGLAFLYAIVALALSLRAFWRDIGDPPVAQGGLWQAMRDAGTLRYLDGGGIGCYNHDDRPNDRRAFYHHLTFYGFALCFASTCVATLWHYLLAREAPYPWWDLPVVLGTLGGIGLIFGPLGLLIAKLRRDPDHDGCRALRHGDGVHRDAVRHQPDRPRAALCCAPRPRCRCCSRCISASCSRCSSPCHTASSCTASIASRRWCATRGSIGRLSGK